jgi:hypothetical protein
MVSPVVASDPSPNTPCAAKAELVGLATCPLCHTEDRRVTNLDVRAGHDWSCSRCGCRWDAARLATVAGYAVWVAAHTSSADRARHAAAAA